MIFEEERNLSSCKNCSRQNLYNLPLQSVNHKFFGKNVTSPELRYYLLQSSKLGKTLFTQR